MRRHLLISIFTPSFVLCGLLISQLSASTAQAQFTSTTFWRHRVSSLIFSTSSQSIYASNCSAVVSVQTKNASGAATNVASNLTVNLSGAGVTYYSDSACTTVITSVTVLTGSSSANFYFIPTSAGSPVLAASAAGYVSASQTETATSNPYIWSGAGGNANWSTAGNWSGGSAPGAGNVAVFDGTCSSNCSPTINTSISILGIRENSAYSGTITQGANTITLGAAGWTQFSGSFAGGSQNISVGGPFNLLGGTFTSTSTTTTFSNLIRMTGTFNHNSGSVVLNVSGTVYNFGSAVLNNLTISGNNSADFAGVTTSVLGSLTLTDNYAGNLVNNGELDVAGNITSTTAPAYGGSLVVKAVGNGSGQTISSATIGSVIPNLVIAAGANAVTFGTYVAVCGNYTFTSASSLTVAGSTLVLSGSSVSIVPGAVTYNNVAFSSTRVNFNLNGNTLLVGGNFTFGDSYASYQINNGTIAVAGNVTALAASAGDSGSAIIQLTGNAAGQTITGCGINCHFPNLSIATGTNPVTMSGVVSVYGSYTVSSVGTFTSTGSTLSFGSSGAQSITTGSEMYNNVIFGNNGGTYNLNSSTINVGGTLTLAFGYSISINSGILAAYANVVGNSITGGNAQLQFLGSSGMNISGHGSDLSGNVTVNLTGGALLTLAYSPVWNGAGQSLNLINGGINMAGYNLTLTSLALNGKTITKNGGTLIVNGTTVGTGSLYGGTVNP